MTRSEFDSIESAIQALAEGQIIVVVDDEDRENEGDLIMAAELATPESMAFMIRQTSGILCAPLELDRAGALKIDPMVKENDAPLQTAFTVSVDVKPGLTTGISAEERSNTVRALANNNMGADQFVRPGHVFPLIAKPGGVLMRSGHTEAGVDLMRLAGLNPVCVLAELTNDDGTVKRLPEIVEFSKANQLKLITIADLIRYRQRQEVLVQRLDDMAVSHEGKDFRIVSYGTPLDSDVHYALCHGDIEAEESVVVRIHRENAPMDLFGFSHAGNSVSIQQAIAAIVDNGSGVLIVVRDGGAGKAPLPWGRWDQKFYAGAPDGAAEQQEDHESTMQRMDEWREVGLGSQILVDLGIERIRLLTRSNRKYPALDGYGIRVLETLSP